MRKALVSLVLVLTVAVAGWLTASMNKPVSAAGWLAQGGGLSRSGRAGWAGCTNPLGCQSVYQTGVSWIYYEPTSNAMADVNAEGTTTFVPLNPYQDYNNSAIPEGCAENGFWHFGRNQQASISSGVANFGDFDDAFYACTRAGFSGVYCGAKDMYSTSYLKWGHLGTYTWEYGTRYDYKTYNNADLDHWIQASNNNAIYHARNYGEYDCGDPEFLDAQGNFHVSDDLEYLKTCPWEAFKAAFYEKYNNLPEEPNMLENHRFDRQFNFRDSNVTLPNSDPRHYDYTRNLYAMCVTIPELTKKLTVRYLGTSSIKQDHCYGRLETLSETKDQPLEEDQVIEDEDEDGSIDFDDLHIANYLNDNWTLANLEIDRPGMVNLEYENGAAHAVHANVADGSVTITVHLEKFETKPPTEYGEEGECPKCSDWTPDAYKSSTEWNADSSVLIGVKNFSLTDPTNGEWHHMTGELNGLLDGVVYAKPKDDVQWMYCYYPGIERAANKTVTTDNQDAPEPANMSPNTNEQNNQQFMDYGDWKSRYEATITNFKPADEYQTDLNGYNGEATPGDDEPLTGTFPGGPLAKTESSSVDWRFYGIQPRNWQTVDILHKDSSEVPLNPGDTLIGNIESTDLTHADRTQKDIHDWQCNVYTYQCGTAENPQTCTHIESCNHDDYFYENNRNDNKVDDNAVVIVPYNFKNRASVKIPEATQREGVTAGGTVTVEDPSITVGKRQNDVTEGEYATNVDGVGKSRIVAFLLSPEDYASGSFWANPGAMSDVDAYGNETDGNGKVWASQQDVCEAGHNTVFNAKFYICKFLDQKGDSTGTSLNENSGLDGETYHYNNNSEPTITTSDADPQESATTKTYNVFDEAAGNYFCVAAAVYPFSVKSDTETDKDGDQSWYVSIPSCVQIKKQPTFQVWGSGIYTGSNADTSVTVKNNVLTPDGKRDSGDPLTMKMGENNYVTWTPTGKGTDKLFGSWVELSATLEGYSKTFASGASTGYQLGGLSLNNALATWGTRARDGYVGYEGTSNDSAYSYGFPAGYQGSENGTFCLRSPMSIGNMNCNGSGIVRGEYVTDYVGGFSEGNSNMGETLKSEVEEMISMFSAEDAKAGGYTYISNDENNNWTISSPETDGPQPRGAEGASPVGTIAKGQTIVQVNHATNNGDYLFIDHDITFEPDATMNLSSLRDVAKYIIYSDTGINISCNVGRIDALLIAKGPVNTCAEGTTAQNDLSSVDWNEQRRSKQLVVNGAIITGGLYLNRTYGSSTGQWSVTPAELINYDTSLYLWSNARAESSISGQVSGTSGSTSVTGGTSEAAMRELAPRY